MSIFNAYVRAIRWLVYESQLGSLSVPPLPEDQIPKVLSITCHEEQQHVAGDETAPCGMGHGRASQFFPHGFSSLRAPTTHSH